MPAPAMKLHTVTNFYRRVALGPGESVVICREFRDFVGKYVAHCHNLAHEDHAMMFGWEIVP